MIQVVGVCWVYGQLVTLCLSPRLYDGRAYKRPINIRSRFETLRQRSRVHAEHQTEYLLEDYLGLHHAYVPVGHLRLRHGYIRTLEGG